MSELILRGFVALTVPRHRDERGDVPGWVMVTVMTAGLVAVLWPLAKDRLTSMLSAAFNGVKG